MPFLTTSLDHSAMRNEHQGSLAPSSNFNTSKPVHELGFVEVPGPSRLHSGYSHALARSWQAAPRLRKDNFVFPLFISDDPDEESEIPSMPGQYRIGIHKILRALVPLIPKGLASIILFGVINQHSRKDAFGTLADHMNGPVMDACSLIKAEYPHLYIICDVCLCEYTDHGHCGILDASGSLNNAASVARLRDVAVRYAEAGADCVAPSDMNDGRIATIKQGLVDSLQAHRVSVMSYSAKFHSAMYGPFREAVASKPAFGNRCTYQLPSGARGLARRAIKRDISEGADFILVKPAGNYLDIIRDACETDPNVPVAAYQVSGEYAALIAAADAGVSDLKSLVFESCEAIARAGATIIISYFTPRFLEWLEV